jgi:hypothetical protein
MSVGDLCLCNSVCSDRLVNEMDLYETKIQSYSREVLFKLDTHSVYSVLIVSGTEERCPYSRPRYA